MKLFRKSILALALCISLSEMSGQEFDPGSFGRNFIQPLAGEIFHPTFSYAGSQYDPEEWSRGSVLLENGELADNVMLRYNGFMDELIWLKSENFQQVRLDKYLVREFTLVNSGKNQIMTFRRIGVNLPPFSNRSEVFAQVLLDGQISLYAYRRISLRGKVQIKTEKGIYSSYAIEPDHLYYIDMPGSRDIYMKKPSRKTLYESFPDQKNEIRSIYQNTRGRISDEEKLILMVKLLNGTLTHQSN